MKLEGAVPADVLAAIRAPFAAEGGAPLRSSIVQPLIPYLDLAGEGLRERLFTVQVPGGEEACLRPDFTLAAVGERIAAGATRLVYEGPAFRVAPPGSGRAEEFLQIGLEMFDTPEDGETVEAMDAAVAALAWRAAAAGGRTDLDLWLGDVGLFDALLAGLEVAPSTARRLRRALGAPATLAQALEAAARGEAAGERRSARLASALAPLGIEAASAVLQDVWALAGIEPPTERRAMEIAERLTARAADAGQPPLGAEKAGLVARFLEIGGEAGPALAALEELARDVPALHRGVGAWRRRLAEIGRLVPNAPTRFETGFRRPFAYYDGMLFEVRSAALGEDRPVAAGGRYDSLLVRLGASGPGRAIGCSVRPYRAWAMGET